MKNSVTAATVIDKYRDLEAKVLECLEEEAEALRRKMRTRRFFLKLSSLVSYLFVIWLGLVVLAPALAIQFNQWATARPEDAWYNTILEMQSGVVTIAFAFWIFSLVLSAAYLVSLSRKRPYVLLLAFIINPLWLLGATFLMDLGTGRTIISSLVGSYLFVAGFLAVLSVMLIGLTIIISRGLVINQFYLGYNASEALSTSSTFGLAALNCQRGK